MVLWTHLTQHPTQYLNQYSHFCTAHRTVLYLTMGYPSPSKLPLACESQPHLIHGSLGPPKSTPQMTSRSLQPFLHSSGSNRQTNRPCYSTCNSRPHLRGITMQPKKNTLFNLCITQSKTKIVITARSELCKFLFLVL